MLGTTLQRSLSILTCPPTTLICWACLIMRVGGMVCGPLIIQLLEETWVWLRNVENLTVRIKERQCFYPALKVVTSRMFDCKLNFGILIFVTSSAIVWLSHGKPVVSGGRNRSTWRKPTPNPKSLATFSHAQCDSGIRKPGFEPRVVEKDS